MPYSQVGRLGPDMPALFTSMSMAPALLAGLVERRFDGVRIRDVDLDTTRRAATGPIGLRLRHGGVVEVPDVDIGARGLKPFCNRPAKPLGAAGHDGSPAVEIDAVHGRYPPQLFGIHR